MIEVLTKEEFNRVALNTAVNPGLHLIGALARLEVARIRQQARSVAGAFEGFMHLRERGTFARCNERHGFGLGYVSFWGFECFNPNALGQRIFRSLGSRRAGLVGDRVHLLGDFKAADDILLDAWHLAGDQPWEIGLLPSPKMRPNLETADARYRIVRRVQ